MKLLTKELEKRFAKVGRQDDSEDPIVIAKFFNPQGAGTWFATEYNPKTGIFFGYASIFGDHNDEWGAFRLTELESYRGPLGLGIERDKLFREKPISQALEEFNKQNRQMKEGARMTSINDLCEKHQREFREALKEDVSIIKTGDALKITGNVPGIVFLIYAAMTHLTDRRNVSPERQGEILDLVTQCVERVDSTWNQ